LVLLLHILYLDPYTIFASSSPPEKLPRCWPIVFDLAPGAATLAKLTTVSEMDARFLPPSSSMWHHKL
ncbi:hypothetical protein GT037_003558, partial [Alternaria burnsii]